MSEKIENKVESPFYTTKDVSKYLRISPARLYRLMNMGLIEKPKKLGGTNLWAKSYIENLANGIASGIFDLSLKSKKS